MPISLYRRRIAATVIQLAKDDPSLVKEVIARLRESGEIEVDDNGFPVRPALIGNLRARNYDVVYLGYGADGRIENSLIERNIGQRWGGGGGACATRVEAAATRARVAASTGSEGCPGGPAQVPGSGGGWARPASWPGLAPAGSGSAAPAGVEGSGAAAGAGRTASRSSRTVASSAASRAFSRDSDSSATTSNTGMASTARPTSSAIPTSPSIRSPFQPPADAAALEASTMRGGFASCHRHNRKGRPQAPLPHRPAMLAAIVCLTAYLPATTRTISRHLLE